MNDRIFSSANIPSRQKSYVMKKQKIIKEDGRYLIYFSWCPSSAEEGKFSPEKIPNLYLDDGRKDK